MGWSYWKCAQCGEDKPISEKVYRSFISKGIGLYGRPAICRTCEKQNAEADKETDMNFVVFDLDDTLACTQHRQHILEQDFLDESEKWNTFFEACVKDQPIRPVINVFNALASADWEHQNRVEIWTGRSDRVREETEMWLTFYVKEFKSHKVELRMRSEGDFRPDTEIKTEWIEKYGKPDIVFDDRNKMVDWWRKQGIVCCQVKESDF